MTALTGHSLPTCAWTKQRPFPSPAVMLSVRLDRYYGRLRRRPGWPPTSRLDTGLRPGPFPRQAASLLPGSLAITRTGLPPAGGDELTAESDHVMIPPSLWAHSRPS